MGYVLGDVAAKIEMCRYFAWRAADYLDKHDHHAIIALAMAVERAEYRPEPVELLGWL